MKKKQKLALAASAALAFCGAVQTAQCTVVYSDDFNRAALNSGTYAYATVATAGDGGAFTDGSLGGTASTPNSLTLTNDISATANANGIVYVSTPTSAYSAPFNPILSANVGSFLTWTLNMEQIRANPSGLLAGNYGNAVILGATTSTFTTANGYALILGNGGTPDPIKLVSFTNGLVNSTQILAQSGNAGSDFMSVKVTYDPASNTWGLLTRDDGTSAFADPTTGTLTSQGTAIDATYTNLFLTSSGAYWAYSTTANQTARFDNFVLDVAVPEPTALSAATLLAAGALARKKRRR
jgi:hypothetical protein